MRTDLPRWPRIAVVGAAVVGLGVGVAGTAVVVGLSGEDEPTIIGQPADGPITLVSYDTCESALDELKAAALPHVGPYGLTGGDRDIVVEDRADAESDGSADSAGAAPGARAQSAPGKAATSDGASGEASGGAAKEHSGTNVHESGVDEPDLVKTDGRRVVTVANGQLSVVDVASRQRTAKLTVPGGGYASQLLLDGDRALVMTGGDAQAYRGERMVPSDKPIDPVANGSRLVLVDLTGAGEILGSLQIDGYYIDARQIGSVARVVMRSTPNLKFRHPQGDAVTESATERNREVVENSGIADWLPRYTLESGNARSDGQLVECEAVSHPRRYTGASLLTVLTVDLQRDLTTGDPISIAADGDTVYGTGTSLYVADDHVEHGVTGNNFAPDVRPLPAGEQRTEVYQFDISGSGKPVHVASGGVEGTLLNQYSLSEHEGNLRIATTVASAGGSTAQRLRSMVTVLTRQGEDLMLRGRVDGLGEGERIYSVRYTGDIAYVVTFRETDPLYTVDLSDPSAPKVTGELKITGYSAYLHPLGRDRLLGVGQEATSDGVATGLQVSLFDTSADSASRVGQFHLPEAYSEVENDPHAFLYWEDKGLIILPVTVGPDGAGMLVLKRSGDRLDEVGVVQHTDSRYGAGAPPPRRALIIGAELWTVSDLDIMVSDLDSLAQRAQITL